MIITLKVSRIIDGRVREAGEVVSVPANFKKKYINKILQIGEDEMADKVKNKKKDEDLENATNSAIVINQDRLKDTPNGTNIPGSIGLLLVGDNIESIEIDGNWWHVSRVIRNGADIAFPSNGWIRDVNLQITIPQEAVMK